VELGSLLWRGSWVAAPVPGHEHSLSYSSLPNTSPSTSMMVAGIPARCLNLYRGERGDHAYRRAKGRSCLPRQEIEISAERRSLRNIRFNSRHSDYLRLVIANDMPYYIECIKVKDVALRIAEALLKKSKAERKIVLDEKANSRSGRCFYRRPSRQDRRLGRGEAEEPACVSLAAASRDRYHLISAEWDCCFGECFG
jgi:hypothetical protein